MSCGCDRSGSRTFCMEHLQEAFDALAEIKQHQPDPMTATGFNARSLQEAVASLIHDTPAVAERLGISIDDVAVTLFIDGLMMGVLLAARAPVNHAFRALADARGGNP